MTHNPSRKQFFAQLLGAAVVPAVLPQLLAKSTVAAAGVAVATAPGAAAAMPVAVRPDLRAVARRAATV